jgi:hypothetical protein
MSNVRRLKHMLRLPVHMLLFFALSPAVSISQTSDRVTLVNLVEQCPNAARALLRGFTSPGEPKQTEVQKICTCAMQASQDAPQSSEQQLESGFAQATIACAKPLAIEYGRRFMRGRFTSLFARRQWSSMQSETFVNCAAERLWSVSGEFARTRQSMQQREVSELINDCSAMVVVK